MKFAWINDWKHAITLWLIVICATIVACFWMTRPFRYEAGHEGKTFDRKTGKYITNKPVQWEDVVKFEPEPSWFSNDPIVAPATTNSKEWWNGLGVLDEPQPPTAKWWEKLPIAKPNHSNAAGRKSGQAGD